MKSVGEVMAIGRTFRRSPFKNLFECLDIGKDGLSFESS